MKKIVISVLLANLLVACASDKPKEVMSDGKTTPAVSAQSPVGAAATAAAAEAAVDAMSESNSLLAKRSVYYAYDQDAIQSADKPVVQAHAKYLADNSSRSMRLEGNADERGSNEYNLALGQRRADGVKKMMILGGARDSQIETTSYGEERPKAIGHEESAWSQNRRTDLKHVK